MKLPFIICELTENEIDIFEKYFAVNGEFNFEGVWFRSQKEINKKSSGWQNEFDERRRVVQFYDTYKIINNNLAITSSYLFVSERLPKNEMRKYLEKNFVDLESKTIKKDNKYFFGDLEIEINKYDVHPNDKYIEDYETIDIIIKTKGKETEDLYNRLWDLSVKGIREKDTRETPTYIDDISEIKKYLPAQVEMGCGPSIEAGIPPLHFLHEAYKVQKHVDGTFYFGEEDDLIYQVINDPLKKYSEFSYMIEKCIKAKTTDFQRVLKKMYDKNIFVGKLLNNNFDRLSARVGIEEEILRVYDINTYFPKIKFDPKARSLICIGTHADRRKVQKQAREQGLKIIYVDCEGFYKDNIFEEYLVEGPKNEDIILKVTATEFAEMIEDELDI